MVKGSELVMLSMKPTAQFTPGNKIRLEIVADPLNELADIKYNAIDTVKLSTDVIFATTTGIGEHLTDDGLSLYTYPNPFNDYTIISYGLPFGGKVTLTIHGISGNTIETLVHEIQPAGDYSVRFNSAGIAPGIYSARIRLQKGIETVVKTIKILNQ